MAAAYAVSSLDLPGNSAGTGALGEVRLVRMPCLDRVVAAKDLFLLRPNWPIRLNSSERSALVRQFRKELDTLARLPDHSNVVKLIGVATNRGRLEEEPRYILMEALVCDIRAVLECSLPWQTKGKIATLLQAARGLRHLHLNNVLHRDFKSTNVLFGSDGVAKVADFGEACVLDAGVAWTPGVGAPMIQAPEMRGDGPKGTPADIFSFGLLILEVDSGAPLNVPEDWRTPEGERCRLWLAAMKDDCLRRIAARCLQTNPINRPTADEIVQLLKARSALPGDRNGQKTVDIVAEIGRLLKMLRDASDTRYVLYLGDTGHGKSSTANTLMNHVVFKPGHDIQSETAACQIAAFPMTKQGPTQMQTFKMIHVDTPGIWDTCVERRAELLQNAQNDLRDIPVHLTVIIWDFSQRRFQGDELLRFIDANYVQTQIASWERMIFVFTFAAQAQSALRLTDDQWKTRKETHLRELNEVCERIARHTIPVAFIENEGTMLRLNRNGKRCLPDGTPMLDAFFDAIDAVDPDPLLRELFQYAFEVQAVNPLPDQSKLWRLQCHQAPSISMKLSDARRSMSVDTDAAAAAAGSPARADTDVGLIAGTGPASARGFVPDSGLPFIPTGSGPAVAPPLVPLPQPPPVTAPPVTSWGPVLPVTPVTPPSSPGTDTIDVKSNGATKAEIDAIRARNRGISAVAMVGGTVAIIAGVVASPVVAVGGAIAAAVGLFGFFINRDSRG